MGEILSTEDAANDFVGYEALIDFINKRKLYQLDGDLIEIGAFMGGGTAKLARFAREHKKKVFVVDIFNYKCDDTKDTTGTRMCDIYEAFLQGRSQKDIYNETTRAFDNIVTIEKDSKDVEFPNEQIFIFGFIDGNHHPDYVNNDFHIIWNNLSPGGIVGFHDYNFDLPQVTEAIDNLMKEYRNEISDIHEMKDKYILLLTKRNAPVG